MFTWKNTRTVDNLALMKEKFVSIVKTCWKFYAHTLNKAINNLITNNKANILGSNNNVISSIIATVSVSMNEKRFFSKIL